MGWAGVYLGLVTCVEDQVTTPTRGPELVVRGYDTLGIGCASHPILSTNEELGTEELLFTLDDVRFQPQTNSCYPNLAQWGVDMADPLGVDTPQGNGYFEVNAGIPVANVPSPPYAAAGAWYTPPQVMIEFDPPVRKVEFYYSRLLQERAWWPGQGGVVSADSMVVRAASRTPGTTSYWYYDWKVIYSNVPSTEPPWNVWTPVTLTSGGWGDAIQWVIFDGRLLLDDLKITRGYQDTTFNLVDVVCSPSTVVRANNVSCSATWTPATIPASEVMFEWRFEGDSVKVFPATDAAPYDPPPAVDSSSQGMASWSGRLVLAGKVSVKATWQGDVDTASIRPTLLARTGTFGNLPVGFLPDTGNLETDLTKVLAFQPYGSGDLEELGALGDNIDSVSNSALLSRVLNGSPVLDSILSGPNHGYWYVVHPGDVRSTRRFRVRTWLTGRAEPLFTYTPAPGVLTARGLLNARRKTLKSKQPKHPDSLEIVSTVVAHEAFGRGSGKGHQGQIQRAAESFNSCGKVPAILDRVVAADSSRLQTMVDEVMREGRKSLGAATWHNFVFGNGVFGPVYEVVSNVTVADNLNHLNYPPDIAEAPHDSLAPNPLFKCARVY